MRPFDGSARSFPVSCDLICFPKLPFFLEKDSIHILQTIYLILFDSYPGHSNLEVESINAFYFDESIHTWDWS